MAEPRLKFTVSSTPTLYARLKKHVQESGLSISEIVRAALTEYFDKRESSHGK